MRVTTDLFVSALLRRVFSAGGFAAVLRRGAAEAGAVFVLMRGRSGETVLYGPASQASYDSARPDDRLFMPVRTGDAADALESYLERQARFDPDLWVIEIEAGAAAEEWLPITP